MQVAQQYDVLSKDVRQSATLRLAEAVRHCLLQIAQDLIGRAGAASTQPDEAALSHAGHLLRLEADSRSARAASAFAASGLGLAAGSPALSLTEMFPEPALGNQIVAQTPAARVRDGMQETCATYRGRLAP